MEVCAKAPQSSTHHAHRCASPCRSILIFIFVSAAAACVSVGLVYGSSPSVFLFLRNSIDKNKTEKMYPLLKNSIDCICDSMCMAL